MNLTISNLSASEISNILGWVLKGFNEPGFADNPWRIVLEERTRARFDDVAAQFVAAGLCDYPPGWHGEPTSPPPWPYDPQAEIPIGDFGRRYFVASNRTVTAFPFRVPSGPFPGVSGGLLYTSFSENPAVGGQTLLRKICISDQPGQMDGALQSTGTTATLHLNVGVELHAGHLMYINHLIAQDAPEEQMGSSGSIVWPQMS